MSAGKGDDFRPVDGERFRRNHVRIFGERCIKCRRKIVGGVWIRKGTACGPTMAATPVFCGECVKTEMEAKP